MLEQRYKYCIIKNNYTFTGAPYVWLWNIRISNDKVGRLRLLKMVPSMYLYDVSNALIKNIAVMVKIQYDYIYPGNYTNEYDEKALSVVMPSEGDVELIYMYPYEHRDWIYPVVLLPGTSIGFGVSVMPSQAIPNHSCYFSCTFIFEDA